jgi:putative oxidoreductase
MSQLSRRAAALARPAHALLRIGAGLLFLLHGLQKFGVLAGSGVPLGSRLGLTGVLELLGLWTRPVAFVLVGEMLAAFLIVHFPRGGWPLQNGGELPLLYALVFAFLAAAGAGPASVDALMRRSAPRS